LRDPTAMLVSQYNWNKRNESNDWDHYGGFERWVRDGLQNRMCKWLLSRYEEGRIDDDYLTDMPQDELYTRSAALLDEFFCIATASDLQASLQPVFKGLGIPEKFVGFGKVSGRDFKKTIEVNDDLRAVVAEKCQADMRIWREYAGRVRDVTSAQTTAS
ncbi:MAG: hypothetical protein AAGA69_09210, partial [Pseudomonadota bacterium]